MNFKSRFLKKKVITYLKKNKKFLYFKNYSLHDAALRQYSLELRNNQSQDLRQSFLFFKIKNFLFDIILIFQNLIFKLLKKNIDGVIFVNNKYKMNLVNELFSNSNLSLGVIAKGFQYKKSKKFQKLQTPFFRQKVNAKKFQTLIQELLIFEKICEFYNPKFFFSIEGDSVSEALIAQICREKKIPHFCLQHGNNSPFIINKNLKYGFKKFFYNFTYLSFSKTHVNYLKKIGYVNKVKIYNKAISKCNFRYKKNIIFCFHPVIPTEGLPAKGFLNIIKLVHYVAKKYPNLKVILRPHPKSGDKIIKDNIKSLDNIKIEHANETTLNSAFETTLVAFFFSGSSTIMDAVFHNTIPIILSHEKWYNFKLFKKQKIGYFSNNKNDCLSFLDKILSNKPLQKINLKRIESFNKLHFYKKDSDSFKKTLEKTVKLKAFK